MDFDVRTLIQQTKLRPALWDHKHEEYHNRHAIGKLWMDIAKQMNVPPEFLRKKWKYLRDQFRLECRRIPIDKFHDSLLTVSDYNAYTTWPFFKPLFFLKSQIKNPTKKQNFLDAENEEGEDESKDISSIDNAAEEENDFEKMFVLENIATISHQDYDDQILQLQEETQTKAIHVENHNISVDDEKFKRLENQLDAIISQGNKCTTFLDDEIEEDKAFFVSILPHIRKLTPAKKMLCRIDMQNIVYKHAYNTD